jgi:hypothetical protein
MIRSLNLTKLGFYPQIFGQNGFIKSTPGDSFGQPAQQRRLREQQEQRALRRRGPSGPASQPRHRRKNRDDPRERGQAGQPWGTDESGGPPICTYMRGSFRKIFVRLLSIVDLFTYFVEFVTLKTILSYF